jgi:pyruvate dehydrogenase (quinone)
MTTVADAIVATLKASGVRRIYGLPGDSLNGLTDALRRDDGLDWVHVRHEEAAAFAAAGGRRARRRRAAVPPPPTGSS